MAYAVRVRREILDQLSAEASRMPMQECCGLLAGRENVITRMLPAVNVAKDPTTAYEIAPRELFHWMRWIRSAGLEFMGIYHSHPNGKNEPSVRDMAQAYYPAAAYFILSAHADAQKPIRAFSIQDGAFAEMEIQIL
jgi:proteasome lid subunit RPN8/RPN11